METISGTLLTLVLSLITYLVYKAWKRNQYWKERRVPYLKPKLFVGNSFSALTGKPLSKSVTEIYNHFPNEKYVGYYALNNPCLIIRDLELIDKVFVKDINYFNDHGVPLNDEQDPMQTNLFSMSGKRWKGFRAVLSPMFSSGKLRLMEDMMSKVGDEAINTIERSNKQIIDMKDLFAKYSMNMFASLFFGVDFDSKDYSNSEFFTYGMNALTIDYIFKLKILLVQIAPFVGKFIDIKFLKENSAQYFSQVIKKSFKHRLETGYKRNDVLQMMLEILGKGQIEVKTKDKSEDNLNNQPQVTTEKFELTHDVITGLSVSFLSAGFGNTSDNITYTLYELTKQIDKQEKVRKEILEQVKKEGTLNYEALKNMQYLEQCVKEALRIYTSCKALMHRCEKEYTLPDGLVLHPGQRVYLPVGAIHNDPKYFSEPEKYLPERFDPGNQIPKGAFMAFGAGPRICIANKLVLVLIKFILAKLLMNYDVKLSENNEEDIDKNIVSIVSNKKDGLYFTLTKLNC